MWSFQYQPLLSTLLQKALVDLCTQSLPWEGRLEIDGIFCVSGKDPTQQIVIKIHKALEKPEPRKSAPKNHCNNSSGGKNFVIEGGKIIPSVLQKTHQKKSPNMPLNLSLSALKTGGFVTENMTNTPVSGSKQAGSQSLRALLGKKPLMSDKNCEGKPKPTILKQPNAPWLRKEGEDNRSLDTASESSDERSEFYTSIKDELMEMADSESSQDADDFNLPATNVTCKICNTTYENFTELQAHVLQVHKRYACRQCCNTFSLRCNLRRHERLHAGVKPHACKFCKKTFSRTADLRAHVRKHTEDSTDLITCSKCPKSFRTAVNLRLHMYKVHKEKDCVFACNICEHVFHDPDEFQVHQNSHRASLLQAGLKENESSCSTPLMNGSQDSMDEDQMTQSETDVNNREIDLSMRSKNTSFLQALASRAESEIYKSNSEYSSPAHFGAEDLSRRASPAEMGSNNQEGNDISLYYGSPLVIKEENDSQDSDMLKRSNRRKSRPSKVTAQCSQAFMEDDVENLAPAHKPASSLPLVLNGEDTKRNKREAQDDWVSDDYNSQESKRPRFHPENLMDNFTMANQSLEDIMKQVNDNLYKDKDVMKAEENEKESENMEKKKKSKSKKCSTSRQSLTPGQQIQPKSDGATTSKPPLVLLVTGGTPKVALPSSKETPSPLRVNIKKDNTNASWTVSPKNKSDDVCLSPILPHNLSLSGNSDLQNYSCSQWGCTFDCIGFPAFEEHVLASHGRYPCKFCSQTFTGRNNRTRHIRYHITGKQHQCSECGKFFARPDSLKEHRFIHTKSYRDSICCNCNVSFEKKATLLSHMKKCFSDEQLDSDKVSLEDTEQENQQKKSDAKPVEPSDVGVMKAEYIRDDILLNKNVIEITPLIETSEDGSTPRLSPQGDMPATSAVSENPCQSIMNSGGTMPILQPVPQAHKLKNDESSQDSEVMSEGVDHSEMASLSPDAVTTTSEGGESPTIDEPMYIVEEEETIEDDVDEGQPQRESDPDS